MKMIWIPILLLLFFQQCSGQTIREKQQLTDRLVGGPCEGCEAIYEWGEKPLLSVDTLPDYEEHGPKLKITGTVYHRDGTSPAANVILYIYHTNQQGIYPVKAGEQGWAKRHGYIRGWVKTGADGKYTFYTLRPGIYPDRSSPAHIHVTVKEPGIQEYYLDDYVFDDDPFVEEHNSGEPPRGGSGLVSLQKQEDLLIAERDIILGLNIPDYE